MDRIEEADAPRGANQQMRRSFKMGFDTSVIAQVGFSYGAVELFPDASTFTRITGSTTLAVVVGVLTYGLCQWAQSCAAHMQGDGQGTE